MRSALIATALSLTLFAGNARAEDLIGVPDVGPAGQAGAAKPDGEGQAAEKHHKEMLKKFDKDGDGKLNEEEKAALHTAMQERAAKMKTENPELFKKLDKDGDGKLTPEEMRAGRGSGKDGKAEMLKRFDKDGDGTLNDAEKAAMQAEMQERAAKMKEKHPELFKKLDQDGDGKLSPEELKRGKEHREKGKKKSDD